MVQVVAIEMQDRMRCTKYMKNDIVSGSVASNVHPGMCVDRSEDEELESTYRIRVIFKLAP